MQEGLSLPNLDELGPVDEETRRQVASENVLQLVQAQVRSCGAHSLPETLTWACLPVESQGTMPSCDLFVCKAC